jgi:hypothetical protein
MTMNCSQQIDNDLMSSNFIFNALSVVLNQGVILIAIIGTVHILYIEYKMILISNINNCTRNFKLDITFYILP